jgi:hypothetical protein
MTAGDYVLLAMMAGDYVLLAMMAGDYVLLANGRVVTLNVLAVLDLAIASALKKHLRYNPQRI